MIIATLLTFQQKETLIGKKYESDAYFNPIQDFYNNWVIFDAEAATTFTEFAWIKDCPKIEYVPIFPDYPSILNQN
jgi:hypothetical protein